MQWARPSTVPKGKVWLRFRGRDRAGEPGQMYQIRDIEENRRSECLDFMEDIFLRDEPLSKILGKYNQNIKSDPVSVATIRANWEGFVAQGLALGCFTEVHGEAGELVGFNNLTVRCRGDDEELDFDSVKGEKWRILFRILTETDSLVDIFDCYGVDRFMDDHGMAVKPEHRGQNIGARLFEAREPLCKAMGIEAISTVFTAHESMALAQKCGYELLGTLRYSDMLKYGFDMTGCSPNYSQLMGKRIHL